MANTTNVQFKRGLSTALPTNNAADGTFYLTTDTNRLYVGNGTNLAEINRYIVTIEKKENLPTQASIEDFVYIKDGNIFAVCTGKDNSGNAIWTQINSVEIEEGLSTDTYVSEVSFSQDATVSGKYNLELKVASKNAAGAITPLEPLTATFTIPVINIGLTSESVTNGAKLKLTGTGSNANDIVNIVGAGGVSITRSNDGKTITATGKTYSIGLNETSIGLKDENDSFASDKVEVSDDGNWIEVSNNNGKLAIAHASKTVTPSTGTAVELTDGTSFKVITAIKADDNNHITGYTTTDFTATNTTYSLEGNRNSNNIEIKLKDQNDSVKSTASVDVTHQITIDDIVYTVKPGDELPAIYSKSALDTKFKGLNAMTYKGTIGNAEQMMAIKEGELGDTYKVSENFTVTYNNKVYSLYVGDLLIINGTEENSTGKVTNIAWDQIEAGERLDTTYTLSATNNEIILLSSTQGKNTLTLSDDDIVTLSGTGNTISASHKTQNVTKSTNAVSPAHGSSFTAITEVTDDNHGHITGYKTTTYTLPGEDKIEANPTNKKLSFKNAQDSLQGSLQFVQGTDISISGAAIAGEENSLKTTINHGSVTRTDTQATPKALAYNESFNIIESITTSTTGHVTAVQTKEITLPAEVTYSLRDVVVDNNNKATWELKNNSDASLGSVKISSTSLNITKDTADTDNDIVKLEMVWGSF